MSEKIGELLQRKVPMFFPNTDKAFREAFRKRWYTRMRGLGLTQRSLPGTWEGQEGTFVWTEDRK